MCIILYSDSCINAVIVKLIRLIEVSLSEPHTYAKHGNLSVNIYYVVHILYSAEVYSRFIRPKVTYFVPLLYASLTCTPPFIAL